jgi:methionyl-tRNA synthetase
MNKNNFYITTPIYYLSGKPHIGHLYTTVLADIIARWRMLLGQSVFFLTGTDEHGQKIAETAKKAGQQPQEFLDSLIPLYQKLWRDFNINYTKFIRTTDPEHKKAVLAFIGRLKEKGAIYKGEYAGWYCVPDEAFVLGAKEGPVPVCPLCGRSTIYMTEPCYFFKLSAYQEQLLKLYREHPNFIMPTERSHEVISFVESGLKDLCISRSTITWGIPFPGDPEQVVYVWLDALTNYISAIGYGDQQRVQEFAQWWPATVHLMGKEIVRFHAVYWPAFLMAAGLPLPEKLLVHGWITVDNNKMSKSLGNVIDPTVLYTLYGADPVRYYLMARFSLAQDGDFSYEDLEHVVTQDLANELGNLLNRMLVLAQKNNLIQLKPVKPVLTETQELRADFAHTLAQIQDLMANYQIHMACAEIKRFIAHVNAYVHALQPWAIAQSDRQTFIEVITTIANCLYALGHLLWPIMPEKMEQLASALGKTIVRDVSIVKLDPWNQTYELKQAGVLFEKVIGKYDAQKVTTSQTTGTQPVSTEITIQDFAAVHMVAGTILEAHVVEKSDKLLRLIVDCGSHGTRQILSGIRAHYTPEMLIGKQGIFVINLKPRSLMGLQSFGMLLTVHDDKSFALLAPTASVTNGSKVS